MTTIKLVEKPPKPACPNCGSVVCRARLTKSPKYVCIQCGCQYEQGKGEK